MTIGTVSMSKFKWKDLVQLNSKADAYNSPLACLCHIDVNAFFAQAEQIRCGYSKDDPIVCVQWTSIIAVSYAARKFNISRMDSITDAIKKSDNKLIPIHTAVYKKGEDFWQYYDGYGSWRKEKAKQLSPEEYKVSLNPYRREARKIFRIFKDWCDLVEIASVDEGFMDLSRLCLQRLLFDDDILRLKDPKDGGKSIQDRFINGDYDLDSYLPPVPESLKSLHFEGLVYDSETNSIIEDWDDVLFALSSQTTKVIRDQIKNTLGYTTSCGIAKTKSVCKLASNFRKPDAQTIIRNKSLETFLDNGNFEITSFWTLGGNLGKDLKKILNLPPDGSIEYIRDTWSSLPELKDFMNHNLKELFEAGEDFDLDKAKRETLASKLFELVRGQYCLPINPRPLIKSMMSNKNMRGKSCNSMVDCFKWLDVFCSELTGRIEELEQEFDKICIPKTVSISIKTQNWQPRTKSGPLRCKGTKLNSQDIMGAAGKLINELDVQFGRDLNFEFYPLRQFSITISNIDIIDSRKTVIDMFGKQAQISKTIEIKPTISGLNIHTKTEDETDNNEIACDKNDYECQACSLTFKDSSEFFEHKDFHVALKLSESLNGADENSINLSLGEKRLLSSNKRKSENKQIKRTLKRKLNVNKSDGILKFFQK